MSVPDPGPAAFDRIAAGTLSGADAGVREIALACGYSVAELASVPAAAIMGLGCGHPLAMADVRPGETVVDVGCGGGLDVLLAAQKVGSGRVIGFDVSPTMVERANLNRRTSRPAFHVADQEALPLPDASADCVLSNGAFRYAERKQAALAEVFRVLKPGGRLSLCDLVGTPPGGAPALTGFRGMLVAAEFAVLLSHAGFANVIVAPIAFDPRVYASPVRPREALSDAARLARWEEASLGCCGIDAEPASAFHEAFAAVDLAGVTAVHIRATKQAERNRA